MKKEVTLENILAAREERQERQKTFQNKYGGTIVSITVNMPGTVKDSPIIRKLLDYAAEEIKKTINVTAEERVYLFTGPEALFQTSGKGELVKDECIFIEETLPFGRMIDLDVFDENGMQITRMQRGKVSRSCFVCGKTAVECRRNNAHSYEETLAAADKLLVLFKAYKSRNIGKTAEKIGSLAVEAMLFEVATTPSPGLVDRVNSGAHKDMDFYTFMSSTAALATTMARCAQAGYDHEENLPDLLPVLRQIGIEGEKQMLSATEGINTQKGLLFSLGIVSAITGYLKRRGKNISSDAVFDKVADITAGIVERELKSLKDTAKLTAGEKLYRTHGVTGIRGEMEQGLPSIKIHSLNALREFLQNGLSVNDALINTLLTLMACVDDTTVMNRLGPEKMRVWVKQKARAALQTGGMGTAGGEEMLKTLDREFIAENVSPGGCADLLSVTWFLYKIDLIDKEERQCLKT
jgi:holo-ACP synthase/triphosphoribosyl-dephospho-CoA synthase